MNTIELNPSIELINEELVNQQLIEKPLSLSERVARFAEGQAGNRIGWFMGSLLWQGVLCLPVPAFLMYYYHAPIWVLIVTVSLFFANLIVGMVGSKTSTLLALLAADILVHVTMLVAFML